jgi:hypothetical protein
VCSLSLTARSVPPATVFPQLSHAPLRGSSVFSVCDVDVHAVRASAPATQARVDYHQDLGQAGGDGGSRNQGADVLLLPNQNLATAVKPPITCTWHQKGILINDCVLLTWTPLPAGGPGPPRGDLLRRRRHHPEPRHPGHLPGA